jgi:hypothetical protein
MRRMVRCVTSQLPIEQHNIADGVIGLATGPLAHLARCLDVSQQTPKATPEEVPVVYGLVVFRALRPRGDFTGQADRSCGLDCFFIQW